MRTASRTLARLIVLTFIGGVLAGAPARTSAQTTANTVRAEGDVRITENRGRLGGSVRSVTLPISVRGESEDGTPSVRATDLIVTEDGVSQEVVSLRATDRSPLSLAVLIQDDSASIGNEIKPLAEFIRGLPEGSRVLVGYIGSGSLRVRQRWTSDVDRAADALRIPIGSTAASPFNPYVQVVEALRRFESLPAGRRAVLLVSDGLDISRGVSSSSPSQSIDLERAIREAQRRSVAIYSFYAPSVGGTTGGGFALIGNAQGSLQRLSDESGGQAFFQGTGAPVSFDPFLRRLNTALRNQLALTYLSTNVRKGFHRVEITTRVPGLKIDHPRGYVR